jgi:hypothetical protein
MGVGQNNAISSIHSSGVVSNWDTVTDLRQDAEDSMWRFFNRLIDDRHALENRIRVLERRLREAEGNRV